MIEFWTTDAFPFRVPVEFYSAHEEVFIKLVFTTFSVEELDYMMNRPCNKELVNLLNSCMGQTPNMRNMIEFFENPAICALYGVCQLEIVH